jgi:hypothetical protein
LIQSQGFNCCAPDGREADYERAVIAPGKVIAPVLGSRIEKLDPKVSGWIKGFSLCVFRAVTITTREPEVIFVVRAAPRHRDDVFNL